jgi:hypothetical protein
MIMEIVGGGYAGEATGPEIISGINRHNRLFTPTGEKHH